MANIWSVDFGLSTPLPVGTVLGGYRVVEDIGPGGTSRVYRAVSLAGGTEVALKVLTAETVEDEVFMQRFERELAICKQLVHPHIALLLDAGEDEGRYYLVMEYLHGEDLKDRFERGPLPPAQALRILLETMDALAFAHSRDIVHRDVKPGNIRLTGAGVKLMDLGAARGAGSTNITQTGATLGTPRYMSPEQLMGSTFLDGRSDQYSLGVTAFELFTGEAPFSDSEILCNLSEPAPSMRAACPEIPEALDAIVLKMLAKEPQERYPSIELAAQDLRRYFKV